MNLCTKCPDIIEHEEHEQCRGCKKWFPMPLERSCTTGYITCSDCNSKMFKKDERGRLVYQYGWDKK